MVELLQLLRSIVWFDVHIAAETGLRATEIRNLKVGDFDFDSLTVKVKAGYNKHRDEDVQPLKPKTAAVLREFFKGKMPTVRAFGPVTHLDILQQLNYHTLTMCEGNNRRNLMIDTSAIYRNPVVPDGFYYMKVVHIDTESAQYIFPKMQIRLVPPPDYGMPEETVFSVIIHPGEPSFWLYRNFCNTFILGCQTPMPTTLPPSKRRNPNSPCAPILVHFGARPLKFRKKPPF